MIFSRYDRAIWKKEAGTSVISSMFAGMPMWITRLSVSAIISRVLESYGYRVGIIAQPDWKDKESIQVLGRPRLGFLVSAGNMDSMVNHYSVSKRRRDKDCLHSGWCYGKTAGLRGSGLLQPDPFRL